ncbi:MAG: hypothetical protein WC340_09135 [Kiritimatiellia bacterium]
MDTRESPQITKMGCASAHRNTLKVTLILMLLSAVSQTRAANVYFTNAAPEGASWFTTNNWTPNFPAPDDIAYINKAGATVHAVVDAPDATIEQLRLSNGDPAKLTVRTGGDLQIGYIFIGNGAPAQLIVTGGYLRISGRMYIGNQPPSEENPGPVEVVQFGGVVHASNSKNTGNIILNDNSGIFPEGYPCYKLVGGVVTSQIWSVGQKGYGAVIMEGGTNRSSAIHVGLNNDPQYTGYGLYKQSGGLTAATRFTIGNTAAYGRYELSGGRCEDTWSGMFCGNKGVGEFLLSGGIHYVKGSLYLGQDPTGVGTYRASGGKLEASQRIYVGYEGGTGNFEVVGSGAIISCKGYTQSANSMLSLCLTNGLSSIAVGSHNAALDGALSVNLLGPNYPEPSSVVTVMTYSAFSGAFNATNLAPANLLLGVRVNYHDTCLTLDGWQYPPRGTFLVIR